MPNPWACFGGRRVGDPYEAVMADDKPPLEIQQAAAKVQAWLDSQKPVATSQPRERAVDRFARTPRSDTPAPQPPWKDPRTT
jgi:hypothetical protein